MPCRPSPEEEAWAAQVDHERAQQQVTHLQQQRATTLALLRAVLEHAGMTLEEGARILRLSEPLPSTVGSTEDASTSNRRQIDDAEVGVCLARFTLLQIVTLLPSVVVAPFSERITAERSDHLRHRLDDCAAELAMLASRIAALTGRGDAAELATVRAEIARLRALGPQQLLANRDFSAAIRCPRCGGDLPVLPGLTGEQISGLAWNIGLGETLQAVKRVHELTGLGFREAKVYVTCPHALPTPEPEPVARSPYRCATCRKSLPPITGLTRTTADHLLIASVRSDHDGRLALLREVTGWTRAEAMRYLACPHRLPAAGRGKKDGGG